MQVNKVSQLLAERFRCPESIVGLMDAPDSCSDRGCVRTHVASKVELPSDLLDAVDALRFERYVTKLRDDRGKLLTKNAIRNLYYLVRPILAVTIRKELQKVYFHGWDKVSFPSWPVDQTVEDIFEQILIRAMRTRNITRLPFIWFWPERAPSCTILTHDVETLAGVKFCSQLMDLDDSFGVKASFQIVPEERYPIPRSLLEDIRRRGFEVNVHDLNHDGHLFSNREEYLRRTKRIREYANEFGALGFRSAVLYRNVDWFDALDFAYDMSIPNVAHLDPQRGGCCTVFPFLIGKLIELPVTAIQDYSLFHILDDYSIRLWQKQIALIRAQHGMMSFIIHPDYIIRERARRVYMELLRYLAELRSQGETWIALPKEVAAWWRMRGEMTLVNEGGSWQIQGEGSERATIAHAVLVDNRVVYEIAQTSERQGDLLFGQCN
jgi:hypothetical protein